MSGKAEYDEALASYDAAREAVLAAADGVKRAEAVLEAAVRAQETAETRLAGHEAYPGIAAYAHAQVPAADCNLRPHCKVHAS